MKKQTNIQKTTKPSPLTAIVFIQSHNFQTGLSTIFHFYFEQQNRPLMKEDLSNYYEKSSFNFL